MQLHHKIERPLTHVHAAMTVNRYQPRCLLLHAPAGRLSVFLNGGIVGLANKAEIFDRIVRRFTEHRHESCSHSDSQRDPETFAGLILGFVLGFFWLQYKLIVGRKKTISFICLFELNLQTP